MIPIWIAFLISLIVIMLISKYDLGVALFAGAIILGLFSGANFLDASKSVFLNIPNLLLALIVSLIPILGGIMQRSNMIIDAIKNLKISKRTALMLTPAIFGLLPIAGGALMSAPILDDVDSTIKPHQKVAINVWFRHVLILIYPLQTTLLIASSLGGISLYSAVSTLIIPCIIMFLAGYVFLTRKIQNEEMGETRNLKRVIFDIFPILIAPIIDLIGRYLIIPFLFDIQAEWFLLIGLILSIFIAFNQSRKNEDGLKQVKFSETKSIAKKMKVWKFPTLIYAIFYFLEIFNTSGIPEFVANLQLSVLMFLVIGFLLGFSTGRVQLPITIIIPIYLQQTEISVIPLFIFCLMYCAIFLGYLITPIHPCLAYSLNYFKTKYKDVLKCLILPNLVCFLLIIATYLISLLF